MILAIVGTRKATNYEEFKKRLVPYRSLLTGIVSGGAKGIDRFASQLAQEWDIPLSEFLPDYKTYGRNATLVRNTQIVDAADRVLAFPASNSKGTNDTIKKAKKQNKLMRIINADYLCK